MRYVEGTDLKAFLNGLASDETAMWALTTSSIVVTEPR